MREKVALPFDVLLARRVIIWDFEKVRRFQIPDFTDWSLMDLSILIYEKTYGVLKKLENNCA